MKATDVDVFERVKGQLRQFQIELSGLSKSKPDNLINKFKLTFINEKLGEANRILTGDFKPFNDFNVFDSEQLPTNSDVVLILSQYLDCLEALRCANIAYSSMDGRWYWRLEDRVPIETQPSTRYRNG